MIPKKDLKIERIRGKGPGGQNVNKVNSCVRITHIPTGTVVRINGRDQGKNLKLAMVEIEKRLAAAKDAVKATEKKAKRDKAIKDLTTIRTYDFKRGVVTDHRTGKTSSIKDVLTKGRFDAIAPKAEEWD